MTAWRNADRSYAIEGGESRGALHDRVHAAVTSFLASAPHAHVVVVAHGGVMRQLLKPCFVDREELRRLDFGNTATHVVRIDPPAWSYAGQL